MNEQNESDKVRVGRGILFAQAEDGEIDLSFGDIEALDEAGIEREMAKEGWRWDGKAWAVN